MRKRSITRQLIVSVALTQLVLAAAVVALATYLTAWQLRKGFDAELHGRAMAIAALVRYSEDDNPKLVFDATMAPPALNRQSPDEYEIVGPAGRVIASSPGWSRFEPHNAQNRNYWDVREGEAQYRVIRLKDVPVLDTEGPGETSPDKLTVYYAASTGGIRERATSVAWLVLLGSVALLLVAIAATVWAVRKGLAPLAELAGSAGKVTAQDWKLNAPPEAQATMELAPLTSAMDRMLATLQAAFTSERDFVANAAHELKTPIAVLKSTLQLALQKPRSAEEYRARVREALDDVARLELLAHSLLRLARAEQLQARDRRDLPEVDVAASCEQSAERWRAVAAAKSVRIEVRSSGEAEVRGDPDDLELIWSNLLGNAVRYSPAGAEVGVTISRENGNTRVDVRDHGPGMGAKELETIFERFHRADASRSRETGGYGLGLAIAKAMTEAYGGKIAAESREGEGTTFSVRLPASY